MYGTYLQIIYEFCERRSYKWLLIWSLNVMVSFIYTLMIKQHLTNFEVRICVTDSIMGYDHPSDPWYAKR